MQRENWDELRFEQASQLLLGEEVDSHPVLGTGAVADREAFVGLALDHVMRVLELRGGGVDPEAEQATCSNAAGSPREVVPSIHAGAMLKHLDPDNQLKGFGDKIVDRTDDEVGGPIWTPAGKLVNRHRRNIDADEVKPRIPERNEVAPIAAADVDPPTQAPLPSRPDNVRDKLDRRL